jgi:hypothetical protein
MARPAFAIIEAPSVLGLFPRPELFAGHAAQPGRDPTGMRPLTTSFQFNSQGAACFERGHGSAELGGAGGGGAGGN